MPYIGLAVIVLFQSEIRRTLARIGPQALVRAGGRVPRAGSRSTKSCWRWSSWREQKTGALIVLERDIGLRTFIESGVRLEARISRDLLLSIFQPGLPLHDGAVIVQKDRIAAAACFLPLTTNPALSRKLGTRHRAAIGITEETDCLSLVVSEETGRISVAAFGELIQGLTAAEVVERINRHFERAAARPPCTSTSSRPTSRWRRRAARSSRDAFERRGRTSHEACLRWLGGWSSKTSAGSCSRWPSRC